MGVTPRSRVAPPRPEAAQAVGDALISHLSGIPRAHEHPLLSGLPEAQHSITRPPRGGPVSRTVYEHVCDVAGTVKSREHREALYTAADAVLRAQRYATRPDLPRLRVVLGDLRHVVEDLLADRIDDLARAAAHHGEAAAMAAFDREVEYEMLGCSSCGRTDFGLALQRVQRMLASGDRGVEGYIAQRLADGLREDAVANREHEAGLIDMDPPQEHETIAAMARAVEVAHGELREAVARQVDAERALEAERREAAKVRQHLADAINSMSSARDMTGDPNVARYLAIAIEQVEAHDEHEADAEARADAGAW